MSAKRIMYEWRVMLLVPDELPPDQEDSLLYAVTEVVDGDQIQRFVAEKLTDFDLVFVEVFE